MMGLKGIGGHMARERNQRGFVEETGKHKIWKGHYFVYQRQPDGGEKRVHKAANLGPKAKLTKRQAEDKLRDIIAKETGADNVVASPECTLRWFWTEKFRPLVEPTWKASSRPKTVRFIENYLLVPFGDVPLGKLDRFTILMHLNKLATKFSKSVVTKFRTYMRAILDEAVEQEIIAKNPAAWRRKVKMPEMREPCHRSLSPEEIRELLGVLDGRDHLILRMLSVLALRPGEALAVRRNDCWADGRLRIDESVSEEMDVDNRIVKPKTAKSIACVWLPPSLRAELTCWLEQMQDKRPEAFLFASRKGSPINLNNFLNRNLKPAAEKALARMKQEGREIPAGFLEGINHQALRRTAATRMQNHGNVKDIQAHLRHASPDMTAGTYMQPIPESVRAAVEALDNELTGATEATGMVN